LVLLAAYNGCRWITQQLESILAQDGVRVEIAVRDDHSTDGTQAELARFKDDARIRLTLSEQRAGSAAQSFFILIRDRSADGFEFVALADQDDVWYPDKLSRACRALQATASAAYSSGTAAVWEDGKTVLLGPSGRQNASDFLFEGAGQGCTFVMSGAFYARLRSFLLAAPAVFEPLRYHDWAIYALARAWGLCWSFDPEPTMTYRQHEGNDTGARGTIRSVLRRFAMIRNGQYVGQLLAICALCAAAAPQHEILTAWQACLGGRRTMRRKAQIIGFCVRGGRRRMRDNIVLMVAVAAGWI
jgi:rhamnosyltransferase